MPQNSILYKLASSQVDYDLSGKWGMTAWAWVRSAAGVQAGLAGSGSLTGQTSSCLFVLSEERLLVKKLFLCLLLGLDTCWYVWQILESFPKKIFRLGEGRVISSGR